MSDNKIPNFIAKAGDSVFDFIMNKNITIGGAELRQLFNCNNVKINNMAIKDINRNFQASDFTNDRCTLQVGSNKQYYIHRLYENFAFGV